MPAIQAIRDFARNLDIAEDESEVLVPALDDVPQIAPAIDEEPEVPAIRQVVPAALEPEEEGRNLDDGYFSSSTIIEDEEVVQAEEVVDQGVNPVPGKLRNFRNFL